MTFRGQPLKTSFRGMRRVIAGLGAGLASTFLLTATAFAQEVGSTADEAGDSGVGGGVTTFGLGDWFGLAVRLALVVAIIWAAVAAMRWYVRRMNGSKRRGAFGALEVLETHALGPNRTLHLVRLGDRAVLIGATPERITQLLTVDDPEELQRLTEEPEDASPVRTTRGGMTSLVSSLGAGMSVLKAMNARRRQMNARIKQQRDAQREAQREAAQAMRASKGRARGRSAGDEMRGEGMEMPGRLANLKSALARSAAQRQALRDRASRDTEPERETRQSLFDRTLASIDAVEIEPEGSRASMGLRARSGYGQTGALPNATPAGGARRGLPRDAQIADLQRAIAVARRNVG